MDNERWSPLWLIGAIVVSWAAIAAIWYGAYRLFVWAMGA